MAGKLPNQGRKLLFSELFKDQEKLSSEKNQPPPLAFVAGDQKLIKKTQSMISSSEFGSPGSSNLSFTSGSFLGSELSSTTTDSDDEGDSDFIAELTKQMADYMLEDDEEIPPEKPHQVEEKEFGNWGISERKDIIEREQILQNGSGMRAVFLGRSGPRTESLGTGVFLPRGTPTISQHRSKKSGCSTVLIPARVLQVLQHHFANSDVKPAIIQSNGLLSQYPFLAGHVTTRRNTQQEMQPQHQTGEQYEDVFLPKEWMY